ncbi:uncharacterized membrane protein YgdD (TMEM256/DUF423 family) [Oceanisphaera litoralis]|uniref:DUF423 domain-containing protein n=1 Tax=Oceanisphaera litoralis TaxID=225144 RepID=UPI00195D668C|nr:DUF423 domain-containing protein [Oceanisphaera litoralis]MBM7455812.1 uncharacterized membrane protein YgdD (TMEM256/DUF423 family) [Oceanisphaera litoralis]
MLVNFWFYLAALLGLSATALGAYGAHGLAASGVPAGLVSAFNTGVQYQFYHALALLLVVLAWRFKPAGSLQVAAACFALGTLLFSGSIYALVLFGTKGIGWLTPLGGVCFMAGWLSVLLAGRTWLRS